MPTPIPPEAEMALHFVAAQHRIPQDQLAFGSQETLTFPLLGRSYTYVTVHYDAPDGFQLFAVLVDPAAKTVEPDFNAVRAAEEAAYRARYGKLDPALYERLQQVADEATLPVAVWAAHTEAARSQAEIEAEIVARYPAAGEALAQKGVLWAVADPELALEIQRSYEQLLTETTAARVRPIRTWLEEQGFTAEEFPGMPVLVAHLPKHTIAALSERQDVAQMMLIEAEETPASDVAIPTDRAPQVWARGYTGTGSRIAILERYNVNATAAACLDIVATRASPVDPISHKSRVAAIAACNDPVLRGIAYGAQIVDAGHDGSQQDAVRALTWATDPAFANRAHVVNHSGSFEDDNVLHFTDRAYDYWVKHRSFTAVIAAGNTSNNVTSPAKAYNVIAVGNVDDNNTVSWSDDVMWGTSSHLNPNTGVEKPEVAAPGTNINTVAGQGPPGTSYAAPQVAGLAALLMQRDTDLKNWPTAVKAIIMASAIHNIEGDRRLSGQDGAGSIDAVLADWIAQTEGNTGTCSAPCWWNIVTTNTYPVSGGNVERTFTAVRGERIRVVIAWLSHADPPTDTSPDRLYRNFDLQVIAPNGETKSSESAVNNFEIVEFTAPATGQYTIRVVRNPTGDRGDEPGGNLLGIAWSKQASYLPDVRSGSGWENTLYVRNSDPTVRPAQVAFSRDNGDALGYLINPTLAGGVLWQESAAFYTAPASAVVDGGEELLALVRNRSVASNLIRLDNGFRSAAGDPAFEQAATTLYVPAFYRALFGNTNSTLDLFNPSPQETYVTFEFRVRRSVFAAAPKGSPQETYVTFEFRGRSGYGDYTTGSYWVPAGGRLRIEAETVPFSPWVGSVRILAGQPVAATVSERNAGFERSFNAAAAGHRLQYVPAAYKNAWNLTTGLVVQNGGSNPVNVTFTFCERLVTNPNSCPTYTSNNLAPLRALALNLENVGVLPSGWSGSVKITSSDNATPLVTIVNNGLKDASGTLVDGYSFNASNYGGRWVYLPYAAHNADGRTTGFTLRNVSGGHISGYAHYYDPDGTLRISYPFTLASAQAMGRHQSGDGLPNGWVGSILLEASGPILAILREDAPGRSAGYNALVLAP
ncbi:putative protease [Caldilinea aerophila DSM 14535 = NBRC 104270]|uniref:Putative protease n=1 Tax=Caldilinea aerophila (strain DSM 14535 / JCM 11387 / NBRC 104270 / STL-6-O1) TaxID=926550 RepID=I0I8D0_CALAS|nr:putative protease [Caldilinea aerophila DSM 14535 = NBRC 104270]